MFNKTFTFVASYGVMALLLQDACAAGPPYIWKIQDLNTLSSDYNRYSIGQYISGDGRTMTGFADTSAMTNNPFIYNEGDNHLTFMNGANISDSGKTYVKALSTDGRVIVGETEAENGFLQAFVFYKGDNRMIRLGTLSEDNSGYSYARAVSADGRVIVGSAQTSPAYEQAFAFYRGDSKMTGLGTLKADNTGFSSAISVSANGQVITGKSQTDSGAEQAFVFYEGDSRMTGLGTLRTDNTGTSYAKAVSANGRVIIGDSHTDSGEYQAFAFYEGDSKMTGLGSLKDDHTTGSSFVGAVSADGRVIVGSAEVEGRMELNAFVYYEGDSKMTGLGTLKADNTGYSSAEAISADGKMIGGQSITDSGDYQAFAFYEGDSKITGLGTLRTDNTGNSWVRALSADGQVAIGHAETESEGTHATVWRLKWANVPDAQGAPSVPGASGGTPRVVMVDATNSHKAMAETGSRGFKVLDLYQSALSSLDSSRCQLGQSDYCVGVFSQMDIVNSNNRVATGLFGSLRLPAEQWTVGGAVNFANHTRLIDNYDTRGSTKPGVGVFTRYQQNRDNTGLNLELSGAFLQQDITITRDQLVNTEAGKGNSTIKGYQARLSADYGFKLGDQTQVSPMVALSYHNIARDRYTEDRQAEFAASYERMGSKRTDLQVGLTGQHHLTQKVALDGGLGANVKLSSQNDAFSGRIDYIGSYAYSRGRERDVRPYAYTGVNVNATTNSTVRASVGWQQTDYRNRNDAAQVGLSYSYHW